MTLSTDDSAYRVLWVIDDGASFGPESDLFTTYALIRGGTGDSRLAQHITTLGRITTVDGAVTAWQVPVALRDLTRSGPLRFDDSAGRRVADFDAVFIRVDPPVTERFRHAMIQLSFEEPRVWFVNSPSAILARGSKLFNHRFHDRLAPGLVSADPDRLSQALCAAPFADFIAKPLDHASGHGVNRLRADDPEAPRLLAELVARYGFIHLQRYVKQVESDGEIRHLVFAGRIIAAWRKRPAPGDFRANLDQGATVEKLPSDHDFSDAHAIIRRVTATEPGFVFYSLDMIGPFINELNVENTGGLPNADALYHRDHVATVVDLLCAELALRRAARRSPAVRRC